MAEEVERVTDPAAPDLVPETTKSKTQKKVAAGRAGAAVRKAKMLEALRTAKESLRSSAATIPRERPVFSEGSRVEGPGTCRQKARCSCCFATTGT